MAVIGNICGKVQIVAVMRQIKVGAQIVRPFVGGVIDRMNMRLAADPDRRYIFPYFQTGGQFGRLNALDLNQFRSCP